MEVEVEQEEEDKDENGGEEEEEEEEEEKEVGVEVEVREKVQLVQFFLVVNPFPNLSSRALKASLCFLKRNTCSTDIHEQLLQPSHYPNKRGGGSLHTHW